MLKDIYEREKLNYCLVKCLSILPNNSILILNELRDTLAVIFQNLHLNKIFWFILHSVLSVCNNIIPGWENEIFLWWCWKTAIHVRILAFTSVKMYYFQFEQENKHFLKKNSPQKTQEEKMSGIIKHELASYWWETPPSQEDLFYCYFIYWKKSQDIQLPFFSLLSLCLIPTAYCSKLLILLTSMALDSEIILYSL